MSSTGLAGQDVCVWRASLKCVCMRDGMGGDGRGSYG